MSREIQTFLLYEGIAFPEIPSNGQWAQSVLERLATLPRKEAVRFKLNSLLATLDE